MEPARVDEHRGLPVAEVAEAAALQRKVGVAFEGDHRREIQSTGEPRLDLVQAAPLDVERPRAGQQTQMVVHRLGHHRGLLARRARRRALVVDERRRNENHRGRGQRRRQRRSPAAPPRARGGRLGPPGGEPTLERERGGVLGQALLEQPRELLLDGVGPDAVGTAVEVSAHGVLRLGPQTALLIVEQVQPDFVAPHPSLTARSP